MNSTQRNIKLVIAYKGTNYKGWQKQKDVLAVQEVIEKTLEKFLLRPVKIRGASRTDAGVHADCQVANFKLEDSAVPTSAFKDVLNNLLPADIAIRESSEVPLLFHSSRDAICKTYHYRIYTGKEKDVVAYNDRWHVKYDLDLPAINAASEYLTGTHDYRGFTSAKDNRDDAVRTIYEANAWASGDDEITFKIRANRFLYLMVRNIVGTLVEVGRGRWPAEQVGRIIQSRDRMQAGKTAQPHGLCLKTIEYSKK
jgi:tRNA pseudouridine38-40 synthase